MQVQAKWILNKERLDRQLAEHSAGATPFVALKEEKESKQMSVMFSEEGVMNDKNIQANFFDRKVSHTVHPK